MPTLSEELRALGHLKDRLDAANRAAKEADAEFKRHQADVMHRMEYEGTESTRVDGVTYAPVRMEYHQVDDRSEFVAWALDNQPELVVYKENADQCNALVRECLDNGQPLPPGMNFRVREYISQRRAS